MKYSTGEIMQIGDLVDIENGISGTIVCNFETGEKTPEFKDWDSSTELIGGGYLTSGILVKTDELGLIHYPEEDTTIKKRK